MTKSNLPAEVHDHFQKANLLHGYVEDSFMETTKHALETGRELLAAKEAVPHKGWESACKRLFDGSLRTAQFYMQFAKNISALKAHPGALLLDGTLKGAANAAKEAVKLEKSNTVEGEVVVRDHNREPEETGLDDEYFDSLADTEEEEYGTTPEETAPTPPRNGTDERGESEQGSGEETPQGPSGGPQGGPPKQYERSVWLAQWHKQIAGTVRMVDAIAGNVGESRCVHHKRVQAILEDATQEMMKWLED